MRLERLEIRGLTVIRDKVAIDFQALGAGLVAIVGPNGAGKTSIMEAVPAALYRTFPSRPAFYEYFDGRDAYISAAFVDGPDGAPPNGAGIEVRLAVDAAKRTAESNLLIDGRAVTDGRLARFADQVEGRFGSLPLFATSVFASQTKGGSFFGMTKAARKDIFAELLGLDHLSRLAIAAAARASAAAMGARDAAADAFRMRDRLSALVGCEERLAQAEETIRAAEHSLVVGRGEVERLAGELATRQERERSAALVAQRVADADAKVATWRQEHKVAKAALAGLDRRLRDRLAAISARGSNDLAAAATRRHAEERTKSEARLKSAEERVRLAPDLDAACEQRARAEAKLALIQAQAEAIAAADREVDDAAKEVVMLRRMAQRDADARAERLRLLREQAAPLAEAPCAKSTMWAAADRIGVEDLASGCPLLAGARAAADLAAVIQQQGEQGADPTYVQNAQRDYAAAQAARAALPPLEHAAPARKALGEADSLITEARAALVLREGMAAIQEDLRRIDDRLRDDMLDAADKTEADDAERRDAVTQHENDVRSATAIVAQTAQRLAEAANDADAAAADAFRLQSEPSAPIAEMLAQAKAGLSLVEEVQRDGYVGAALAKQQVEEAAALRPEVDAKDQEIAAAAAAEGEWGMLEVALGRDGVQALEIDASGPEVAGLTNELLLACYGARFSLTLETLGRKIDGGQKEVFEVIIHDKGIPRPVEALSGGEKVIVGEALSLALAIFNARKNDIRWETLWRDETAGQLDPENAAAYVRMLRRALALGGFHQIIFVAHQAEVWTSADAQIFVAAGKVQQGGGMGVTD